MPHRHHDGGEDRELHPVATDQPGGLVITRPLQKLRQIAVVYALLPLIAAGAGAYIATQVAHQRAVADTDRRLAALERDLAERRRVRDEQQAGRDAQTRDLLVLVCTLLDRAQPRDAAVDQARARYGCTGGPYAATTPPGPSTAPSPGVKPGSTEHRPGGPGQSRVTAQPARPRPTVGSRPVPLPPPPVPRPPPARPDDGGHLLCVDLPLLPELCVL